LAAPCINWLLTNLVILFFKGLRESRFIHFLKEVILLCFIAFLQSWMMREWNTGTELDTHAQGKQLEKRFRWCYVNCEDHESERKRRILIFEMNGSSMAFTKP
jgi:hypothetical protein